ncbi:MAG: hypothetical protein IAE65_01660, partial [Ignavibacteria bacterium]|nr:hypothetical protein [Ignavibacteria bacterium]
MIIRFKFFLILFYFTSCNYENNIIEHYSKNKDRLDYLIEIINNKNHINFINLRNFTDSYLDLVFPNITTFKIASFSGEKIFEIKSDKEFEMLNYLDSVLNQKYLINKRSPITEGDSIAVSYTHL